MPEYQAAKKADQVKFQAKMLALGGVAIDTEETYFADGTAALGEMIPAAIRACPTYFRAFWRGCGGRFFAHAAVVSPDLGDITGFKYTEDAYYGPLHFQIEEPTGLHRKLVELGGDDVWENDSHFTTGAEFALRVFGIELPAALKNLPTTIRCYEQECDGRYPVTVSVGSSSLGDIDGWEYIEDSDYIEEYGDYCADFRLEI